MQIKTQETNFCRQFLQQLARTKEDKRQSPEFVHACEAIAQIARRAVKFILPYEGRLYDNLTLSSLNETEPLHLPFPCIALEYTRENPSYQREIDKEGRFDYSSKTIVFAMDDDPNGSHIEMCIAPWIDRMRLWVPRPPAFIPKTGYLSRSVHNRDGRPNIVFEITDAELQRDYYQELDALMGFLNLLQCHNVHIEQLPARQKTVRRKHEILPFDSYHILTVDTASRERAGHDGPDRVHDRHSPREHLRRGHIRRLADGRRLWINAMVVAAGNSGGKIYKSYRLNAPPHEHIAP